MFYLIRLAENLFGNLFVYMVFVLGLTLFSFFYPITGVTICLSFSVLLYVALRMQSAIPEETTNVIVSLLAEISSLTVVVFLATIVRVHGFEPGLMISYIVFQFSQTILATLLILIMRHYGAIKEDDHNSIARF